MTPIRRQDKLKKMRPRYLAFLLLCNVNMNHMAGAAEFKEMYVLRS